VGGAIAHTISNHPPLPSSSAHPMQIHCKQCIVCLPLHRARALRESRPKKILKMHKLPTFAIPPPCSSAPLSNLERYRCLPSALQAIANRSSAVKTGPELLEGRSRSKIISLFSTRLPFAFLPCPSAPPARTRPPPSAAAPGSPSGRPTAPPGSTSPPSPSASPAAPGTADPLGDSVPGRSAAPPKGARAKRFPGGRWRCSGRARELQLLAAWPRFPPTG
jgi:hypothetical protein